jgi:hypothetical protein
LGVFSGAVFGAFARKGVDPTFGAGGHRVKPEVIDRRNTVTGASGGQIPADSRSNGILRRSRKGRFRPLSSGHRHAVSPDEMGVAQAVCE